MISPVDEALPYNAPTFFPGVSVKFSALLLVIFSLSVFAQDELGSEVGKYCETAEIKKLIGKTGSCRVIVAPKNFNRKLTCSGVLGTLNCQTIFDPLKMEKLNLFCHSDGKPQINYDFESKGVSHNIAVLVKKADGTDAVEIASSEITIISSDTVNITMEEIRGKKAAVIQITYQPGYTVALQNVVCQ